MSTLSPQTVRPWTLHKHCAWTHTSIVTVSILRRECARDPVQNLLQSVIRASTCGLTESLPVSQNVQAQLLGDFGRSHRIRQFLLNVRKPAPPHRASRPRSIAADIGAGQTVYSLVVLASHGPDLILAFHVPHGETRSLPIIVLSSCVRFDHPYPHLGLTNHALPCLRALTVVKLPLV